MDALPNTGLHPFVKATPARYAAAAPKLTRQVFPRYSSFENKQNAHQGCTIVDPRSFTFRRATVSRKMSFYKRPKVVGKKCLGHAISPAVKTAVILCPDCSHVPPHTPADSTGRRNTLYCALGFSLDP